MNASLPPRSRPSDFRGGPRATLIVGLLLFFATHLTLGQESSPTRPGSGFSYQRDDIKEVPWSIHIAKIARTNADIELHTTLGGRTQFGLTTLSEHLQGLPRLYGRPIAGLNGDFFVRHGSYEGDPEGLQIMRGELISAPSEKSCFWIDPQGEPHITNVTTQLSVKWPDGRTSPIGLIEERLNSRVVLYTAAVGSTTQTSSGRELILEKDGDNNWLPLRPGETYTARVREIRNRGNSPLTRDTVVLSLGRGTPALPGSLVKVGDVITLSTATTPDLKGVITAISGGPALVHAGRVTRIQSELVRHPRSALGFNRDFYYFVEVDGRQRQLSVGMTLPELAEYLKKIGCDEAINLDGGGSATLWCYGQVMNSPCEGSERGMGNAIVAIRKEK